MVAISQQGTSVLFTSHPKDGLVVNLYIPHNRRMPLQAEEALGPISILRGSCGTVALYGLFINFFFLADHGIGLRISLYIKNLRNSYQEYVAPFNSNFHNKTLCESGVMWITRFVTYLSIAFHIYLLIIIHF
jgi:hypothetical protein